MAGPCERVPVFAWKEHKEISKKFGVRVEFLFYFYGADESMCDDYK